MRAKTAVQPSIRRTTQHPPLARPVMIYDGDCGFCRRWIARWRRQTGDRIHYVPFQEAAGQFPQVPLEQFEQAVHLVEPTGEVSSGAHAVLRALALAGRWRWLWGLYQSMPGVAAVAEGSYRFVARHRGGLARIEDVVAPDRSARPQRDLRPQALFIGLLGLTCLAAFLAFRRTAQNPRARCSR